jgi:hypothetical protein
MRRLAILLVPLLLVGAACGGDDDDDSAGGDGAAAFCADARAVDQEFSGLEELAGDELPSADAMNDAGDALADLAKGAPAAVKDDLEAVASTTHEIAEALGGIDFTDPSVLTDPANAEELRQVGERMQAIGTDFRAASDRVQAYLRDECGIDAGVGDDGSSGSSTEDGS